MTRQPIGRVENGVFFVNSATGWSQDRLESAGLDDYRVPESEVRARSGKYYGELIIGSVGLRRDAMEFGYGRSRAKEIAAQYMARYTTPLIPGRPATAIAVVDSYCQFLRDWRATAALIRGRNFTRKVGAGPLSRSPARARLGGPEKSAQ